MPDVDREKRDNLVVQTALRAFVSRSTAFSIQKGSFHELTAQSRQELIDKSFTDAEHFVAEVEKRYKYIPE